jgi:hypothetical protein
MITDDLDLIQAAVARIRATTVPPAPLVALVKAGDNLQAALDKGGAVELEAGAQFTGTFTLRSGTTLTGRPGAALRGQTGQALLIPPGTTQVAVANVEASSAHAEVISVGANDATQTTLAEAPDGVTFTKVNIPTHRGKRAFAIHGQRVTLQDCTVADVYDPGGQDSQAVYVGNAPGTIAILGGSYSAGSEILLFGGDTYRIPGLTPNGILVDGVTLSRPLSWMTDGIARKVKNIFELKNGTNVIVRHCTLSGCWANGQQGEAFVLTPALDGAKQTPPLRSGEVFNVLIEDCTVTNVSSVTNMIGRQYTAYTVNPLSGVVFRRVTATVSRAQFGGRGQLAMMGGEPVDVTFDDCTVTADGTSLLYYSGGTCLDPVTLTSRASGKLGSLTMTNCRSTIPQYGIMLNGVANAGSWQTSVGTLVVTGNSFTGSKAMQKALPDNTYA